MPAFRLTGSVLAECQQKSIPSEREENVGDDYFVRRLASLHSNACIHTYAAMEGLRVGFHVQLSIGGDPIDTT